MSKKIMAFNFTMDQRMKAKLSANEFTLPYLKKWMKGAWKKKNNNEIVIIRDKKSNYVRAITHYLYEEWNQHYLKIINSPIKSKRCSIVDGGISLHSVPIKMSCKRFIKYESVAQHIRECNNVHYPYHKKTSNHIVKSNPRGYTGIKLYEKGEK